MIFEDEKETMEEDLAEGSDMFLSPDLKMCLIKRPPIHCIRDTPLIWQQMLPYRTTSTPYTHLLRQPLHGKVTSTPYFRDIQASGDEGRNLVTSYDSGLGPSPCGSIDHDVSGLYGHRSFDILSDTDHHMELHPQLNYRLHFEDGSEEMKCQHDSSASLAGKKSLNKRRSLELEKSPSPNRGKRLSFDLGHDSGNGSLTSSCSISNNFFSNTSKLGSDGFFPTRFDLCRPSLDSYPLNKTESLPRASATEAVVSKFGMPTSSQTRQLTFEEKLAQRKLKLDQEIGHRMGTRFVDVFGEFVRKNFTEPLAGILNYLSEDDLCSLCLVCHQWKAAVESDLKAKLRRQQYVEANRKQMAETPQENRTLSKKPAASRKRGAFVGPSRPLSVIQATKFVDSTPSSALGVVETTRAERFFQEARTLDRCQSLRKCPKCDHPARVNEIDWRAQCTKELCHFEFCVKCRMSFHAGRHCVTEVKRPPLTKIGGKQSRQNLRRL